MVGGLGDDGGLGVVGVGMMGSRKWWGSRGGGDLKRKVM